MNAKRARVGKQKHLSAAKKRVGKTGKGTWKMQKAGRNHLLMQKSKRQKKLVEKPKMMSGGNAKRIAKLLPSM